MKQKKMTKQEKMFYRCLIGLGYILIMFFCCHFFNALDSGVSLADAITLALINIETRPLAILPIPFGKLFGVTFFLILLGILYSAEESKKKNMMPGKEEGSAKWNDDLKKYNKKYTSPKGKETSTGEDNMIFTDDVFMSMNTRQTRRNNNILVIGGSGAGKSRFFVKPNLLQANCSYVITDPSGELLETCGGFLEQQGYKVKIFNLVEMQYSHHYNPFDYIRNDEGVLMMINCLIKNTTPDGASKGDPFWEKSETALLLAICFYLQYEVRKADRNFTNVMRLLLLAQVKEDQEDFKSTLDIMFEDLEAKKPDHIAVRYYKIFKMGAGKTLKSILISCTVRLGTFNLKAVQDLTSNDTLDLGSLGDEKQALFVVISAADTTFNYLVSMMYSQLFETLYFHAENECKGKRLPSHVRFMLDEFANIGTIPDFEKKLATMRKYEISCSIILQNLAQLKTMYKDAWESITGNCDSFLFLGGQEQTTLEYVSKKLGKRTITTKGTSNSKGRQGSYSQSFNQKGRDLMSPDEISRMDDSNCIFFIRGLFPFFSKKYDYPKHKNYKYTGDADSSLNYEYRDEKKYLIKEDKKKPRTRNRASMKEKGIKPDRQKSTIVRSQTSKGEKTYDIKDATKETTKALGIDKENQTSSFKISAAFCATHEFTGADNFSSDFLLDDTTEIQEPVKEVIPEPVNDNITLPLEKKERPDEPEFQEEIVSDEFDLPDDLEMEEISPDEFNLPEEFDLELEEVIPALPPAQIELPDFEGEITEDMY